MARKMVMHKIKRGMKRPKPYWNCYPARNAAAKLKDWLQKNRDNGMPGAVFMWGTHYHGSLGETADGGSSRGLAHTGVTGLLETSRSSDWGSRSTAAS
jgi:hypothetical protein